MDPYTYILLDIPEPLVSHIMAFRRQFHKTERPDIPPGLSGAGPLVEDQDEADVLVQLHDLVRTTAPIRTTFTTTARFPNTTMVYLAPRDDVPFNTLTERILMCGIRVVPTLFMDVPIPHCTIAWFEEDAEQEIEQALRFPVPNDEFVFDTLSMYTIQPTGVLRRWAGTLVSTITCFT
jgi:hypothetical protein